MHKVFAVLLLTLFLFSCTKSSGNSKKLLSINSDFKNKVVYTAPGDFNGDGKMESIFITKQDENCCISILDKGKMIYKKLNYKVDDFKLTVQDINNDNKEDIILNIIQNDCENCYVYTLGTGIINIFSPELIKAKISQQLINNDIAKECGNFNLSSKQQLESDIKLYYTEMDYTGDEPVLISEGSVYNKDTRTLNIQAIVTIDKSNNITVRNINMFPVQK